MTGAFIDWARRGGAKQHTPSRYPWMDTARAIACGWCDHDFASCLCFGSRAPAEPARPNRHRGVSRGSPDVVPGLPRDPAVRVRPEPKAPSLPGRTGIHRQPIYGF